MEVYVIPFGGSRYALYCETAADAEADADAARASGVFGRMRHRFRLLLRAAEERQQRRPDADLQAPTDQRGILYRLQDRLLAWIAQRIAEQRLLWNLRGQTAAVLAHPPDMMFDQVMTLVRRILQRDYDRHRLWLVVDAIGLILSGPIALIPGPNVLAYYFTFRVVGHWLSMRGAVQGMHRVAWTGRPCPPLTELRDLAALDPGDRDARVHDIAARLRLQHLSTFFERVALRHAA